MAKLNVPILVDWESIKNYMEMHDIVEVVRCKDCNHFFRDDNGNVVVYRCELNHEDMRDDFYCADGEVREDERIHSADIR